MALAPIPKGLETTEPSGRRTAQSPPPPGHTDLAHGTGAGNCSHSGRAKGRVSWRPGACLWHWCEGGGRGLGLYCGGLALAGAPDRSAYNVSGADSHRPTQETPRTTSRPCNLRVDLTRCLQLARLPPGTRVLRDARRHEILQSRPSDPQDRNSNSAAAVHRAKASASLAAAFARANPHTSPHPSAAPNPRSPRASAKESCEAGRRTRTHTSTHHRPALCGQHLSRHDWVPSLSDRPPSGALPPGQALPWAELADPRSQRQHSTTQSRFVDTAGLLLVASWCLAWRAGCEIPAGMYHIWMRVRVAGIGAWSGHERGEAQSAIPGTTTNYRAPTALSARVLPCAHFHAPFVHPRAAQAHRSRSRARTCSSGPVVRLSGASERQARSFRCRPRSTRAMPASAVRARLRDLDWLR